MNRKKNITKLVLLFSVLVGIMGFIASEAVNLTFNFEHTYNIEKEKMATSTRLVHFSEFKNDFGGLFYFDGIDAIQTGQSDNKEDYGYEIIDENNNTVSCRYQLKGFYYNAERGERLRPIDEETMNTFKMDEQGLEMNGGIYTNCRPKLGEFVDALSECNSSDTPSDVCIDRVREEYSDMFSYYGGVTHTYSGQKFILAVGINYLTGTPWIDTQPELGKTFQRHPDEGGMLPFGLLYDNLGGVGFAGCKVYGEVLSDLIEKFGSDDNSDEIYELFKISEGDEGEDPYLKYIYEDRPNDKYFECKNLGLDNSSALNILVEGLIGMGREHEISYYKGLDNKAALQKTQYFASTNINNATLINHARQKAEILCRGRWQNSSSITDSINCIKGNISLNENNRNKTIIVKDGNVTISPFTSDASEYYDIFIDSGNLIIDENSANRFVIKNNGFVSGTDISGFYNTVQSIMESGEGEDKYRNIHDIGIASILKGNFIVNGHIKSAGGTGLGNKYFIYGKLTSLDDNESLLDVFNWKCEGGKSSDGSYCPGLKVGGAPNQYQFAPLVIIDQNYNSPLLK